MTLVFSFRLQIITKEITYSSVEAQFMKSVEVKSARG